MANSLIARKIVRNSIFWKTMCHSKIIGIFIIITAVHLYSTFYRHLIASPVAPSLVKMTERSEREREKGFLRSEDYMFVEKVEKVIDRISGHKGVEGVIVCDKDGAAIHTTMDNTNTVMYAECIRNMCNMGLSMIRDVDPTNDLTFIRVGTKKLEMMATLNPDYLAIAVQSRIKSSKN